MESSNQSDKQTCAVAFQLISPEFADGRPIPARFSCEGEDVSPPLQWSGAPPVTASFALICEDPDAPAGTWFHWAIFDLARDTRVLPAGFAPPANATVKQGTNDFGRVGYGGPCPPLGHREHHYRFSLYALDTSALNLKDHARCAEISRAAKRHAVAVALLTGTYQRK